MSERSALAGGCPPSFFSSSGPKHVGDCRSSRGAYGSRVLEVLPRIARNNGFRGQSPRTPAESLRRDLEAANRNKRALTQCQPAAVKLTQIELLAHSQWALCTMSQGCYNAGRIMPRASFRRTLVVHYAIPIPGLISPRAPKSHSPTAGNLYPGGADQSLFPSGKNCVDWLRNQRRREG